MQREDDREDTTEYDHSFEKIRRRVKNPNGFEEPTIAGDLCWETTSQMITNALRERLISVGVKDATVLARAAIYQAALDDLSLALSNPFIPENLRLEAHKELEILIFAMAHLFTGQTTLQLKIDSGNEIAFEGYIAIPDALDLRVITYQKISDSYSDSVDRITHSNCQIHFKHLLGRTPRGKAIAGPDTSLRCGLRYVGSPKNAQWVISLDSGQGNHQTQDWRVIRPLSQAISCARLDPSFDPQIDNTCYTHHYKDPSTQSMVLERPVEKLWRFNEGLSLVFRQISGDYQILDPGLTL